MLFKLSNIKPKAAEKPLAFKGQGKGKFVDPSTRKSFKDALGKLEQETVVHIPSFGSWSLHNVLDELLNQTGPAEVLICTWTIAEEPARKLVKWHSEGRITKFGLLVSDRIKTEKPKAFQLMQAYFDCIKLVKLHAKILVISNANWQVCVVSTANLSNNNRIECFVVDTHSNIASGHKTWITKKLHETI